MSHWLCLELKYDEAGSLWLLQSVKWFPLLYFCGEQQFCLLFPVTLTTELWASDWTGGRVVIAGMGNPALELGGPRWWYQHCFWLVFWPWGLMSESLVLSTVLVPLSCYKLITMPSAPFQVAQHSKVPWVFLLESWSTVLSSQWSKTCLSSQWRGTSLTDFLLLVWVPWWWSELRKAIYS